jgi:hypothetical protein
VTELKRRFTWTLRRSKSISQRKRPPAYFTQGKENCIQAAPKTFCRALRLCNRDAEGPAA